MDHKIKLQRNFVDLAKNKFDEFITQTTKELEQQMAKQESNFKHYLESETRAIIDLGLNMVEGKPMDDSKP